MTPSRLRSASAALLLALFCGTSAVASQRDGLVAKWIAANEHAVATIDNTKARAAARAAFDKARARLDEPVPAQDLAVPDFAAVARRELAVPGRYQLAIKVAPPPVQPWYERGWQWLMDRLHDLWQALFGRVHLGRGGAIAIGDLLIGALVLALIFVAIRFIGALQFERRRRASQIEALAPPANARELYERAHAAAGRGDLATASRLLFAATLVALDLRGAVVEDPSATVGDLRRTLRSREAGLVVPFDLVAAPFVASAYAERPVATADWERAREAFLTFAPERGAT